MLSPLTSLLLVTTCAAHQAHKHAAFHERHLAAPQPADPPSEPRLVPRDFTTTLYRTFTETAHLFSAPSPLPSKEDDLPPWADKLVDKILQAIGTACSPPGSAWTATAGSNDSPSSDAGRPVEGSHSGWNSDPASADNGHNSDGTSGNEGGVSVDGQWPPAPPHNPHNADPDASNSASGWSSPPESDDENESGASASDGQHWQQPSGHHSWGPGTSKSPSTTTTASRPIWSSATRSPHPQPTDDPWPDHVVTGYYGSGQAAQYPPSSVPWQYLTHLCFAFATTTSDFGLKFDPVLLSEVSSEAHRNGVKPVLSIGGYGAGGRYFSEIVENNATIAHFVQNVKNAVDEFDLAGVDIDWEFVGRLANPDNFPDFEEDPATDAAGYLNLLKALRGALGSDIELSAAVPMYLFQQALNPDDPGTLTSVNMEPYVPYFDHLYLMGYDLWNGDDTAGANAAMTVPAGSQPIADQQYTSQGLAAWGASFPMEKLVYGVPFYGYGYKLAANSTPATEGLYSPVTGRSRGDNGESADSTSGFWRWRNLKSQGVLVPSDADDGTYVGGEGWETGWNEETQTPYVYSVVSNQNNQSAGAGSYGEIISYDDPNSLRLKRKYAQGQGVAGMMFWIASADTEDGELASVLA